MMHGRKQEIPDLGGRRNLNSRRERPVEMGAHVQILASAILEKCDYLVTGDKRDFGHLYNQTVSGITIVNYLLLTTLLKI
jgi:hypothetical protein